MRTRSGNIVGGGSMGARICTVAAVAVLLFLLMGLGALASASILTGADGSGPILPVETGLPVYLAPKDAVSDPFVTIVADMERFAALKAAVDISGTRDDGAPVQMNDVYCAITRGAPGSRDSIQCSVFLSEGFYQAVVKVWDQSGISSASGSFAVSVPVKFVAPLASSVNANFTLQAEMQRYAATRARLDVTGVRADGVQVGVNDIYCAISRGAPGSPDTISCPVALSDGDYQAALKIWDQNGYLQTEVDAFTVSSPITNLSPAGTLSESAFDIRANMEPSVAQRAEAGITGVLHGGGDFEADDIYCGITRGTAGEHDIISCPVSLSDGDYQVTLQVWDANGFMRTAASTLTVSMRPALSVQAGGSFWHSYADYQARRLTALMIVSNTGAIDASAVRITGSYNSNGVTPGSAEPIECGDLGAGAQAQVYVTFSVPAGVSSFSSRLKATAVNSNGTVYNYPA